MEFRMLVISRKKSEKIFISGGISIMVISVRGDQVQLGIEAPADVKILRSELEEKKDSDDASAH
jgi:carbon storage regulator